MSIFFFAKPILLCYALVFTKSIIFGDAGPKMSHVFFTKPILLVDAQAFIDVPQPLSLKDLWIILFQNEKRINEPVGCVKIL